MIYSHLAAALVSLLLGFTGGWKVQTWRHAQLELDRVERQAEIERLKRQANQGVSDGFRKTAQAAAVAAAAARAESERLRDTLADLAADTGAGEGPNVAATAARALGECSARYQEVAGVADALSAQVRGLQGYVGAVCLGSSKP